MDDLFAVRVQLWHLVRKGKRIVTSVPGTCLLIHLLPVIHHKPARIRGLFPVFLYVQPWREILSTMVEHGVHHHPDSVFMRLFDKMSHHLGIPKLRIDSCIILRIILMVRICLHNRV